MNTTENNKLILDFRGLIPEYETTNPLFNITYCYHSNWDLLMQVVEKIESLHESNNVLIGTNITYVQIHNKVRNEQETFKGVADTKIEAVYNACVTFINWYNENKI